MNTDPDTGIFLHEFFTYAYSATALYRHSLGGVTFFVEL